MLMTAQKLPVINELFEGYREPHQNLLTVSAS